MITCSCVISHSRRRNGPAGAPAGVGVLVAARAEHTVLLYVLRRAPGFPAFEELGPELLRYAWPGPLRLWLSAGGLQLALPGVRGRRSCGMLAFANPNTMEAEMANHLGVVAEEPSRPALLPALGDLLKTLNLVQSAACKNRAWRSPHMRRKCWRGGSGRAIGLRSSGWTTTCLRAVTTRCR